MAKIRRFGSRKFFGPKIAPKQAPKIRFRAQNHKNSQIQGIPVPFRDRNRPKIVLKLSSRLKTGNSVPFRDRVHPKTVLKQDNWLKLGNSVPFRDRIHPKIVLKLGNWPKQGNLVPFRGRNLPQIRYQIWSRNSDFGSRVTKSTQILAILGPFRVPNRVQNSDKFKGIRARKLIFGPRISPKTPYNCRGK